MSVSVSPTAGCGVGKREVDHVLPAMQVRPDGDHDRRGGSPLVRLKATTFGSIYLVRRPLPMNVWLLLAGCSLLTETYCLPLLGRIGEMRQISLVRCGIVRAREKEKKEKSRLGPDLVLP